MCLVQICDSYQSIVIDTIMTKICFSDKLLLAFGFKRRDFI